MVSGKKKDRPCRRLPEEMDFEERGSVRCMSFFPDFLYPHPDRIFGSLAQVNYLNIKIAVDVKRWLSMVVID
jgi:hypothetical protein